MSGASRAALGRWLALGEAQVPAGTAWLARAEAARAAGMAFPKRRTEYLLRRAVAKYAVALATGRAERPGAGDPAGLAAIEVANAASGAPYVLVDGAALGTDVSLSDRAGWAVCLLGPRVGCDLELVEPRGAGLVRDFFTPAERSFVAGQPAGDARAAAATLVWSAKETALKVLGVGLGRDPREVEVELRPPGAGGWGVLTARTGDDGPLPGWWRRDGRFVLTVAAAAPAGPPEPLADPTVLARARPRHSWLGRRPGP
jgi:4'-phosphopantetheinyl transferase